MQLPREINRGMYSADVREEYFGIIAALVKLVSDIACFSLFVRIYFMLFGKFGRG